MIVTEEQVRDEVLDAIKQHNVMLFMKGVPRPRAAVLDAGRAVLDSLRHRVRRR